MEHPLSPQQPLTEEAVSRVIVFETLSPAGVAQLGEFTRQRRASKTRSTRCRAPAIQGIFSHMFEALEQPRFVVTGRVVQRPAVLSDLGFPVRLPELSHRA